jgi:DNA-binding transcriptional LysR family regulator
MKGEDMDRLAAMELFVRVVETGSFSAAAREAGMTQPSVSRQLRALEKRLGARLLNRSTRHNTLTEAGRACYEDCRRIIAEVSAGEGNLGALQSALRGTLKVNTSVALGEDYIAPIAYQFQRQHPELAIDLTLNERFVDLIEEGIDLAIRFGPIVDENPVARRLGSTRRLTVAAPAYLRKRGTPQTPSDLTAQNCIAFNYAPATEWVYASRSGETRVRGVGYLPLEQRPRDPRRSRRGAGRGVASGGPGARAVGLRRPQTGVERLCDAPAGSARGLSVGATSSREGAGLPRSAAAGVRSDRRVQCRLRRSGGLDEW